VNDHTNTSIPGRLLTPTGGGLTNAFVIITDTNTGEVNRTRGTSLGYFQDLQTVISTSSVFKANATNSTPNHLH
jgi:hypothetical protein